MMHSRLSNFIRARSMRQGFIDTLPFTPLLIHHPFSSPLIFPPHLFNVFAQPIIPSSSFQSACSSFPVCYSDSSLLCPLHRKVFKEEQTSMCYYLHSHNIRVSSIRSFALVVENQSSLAMVTLEKSDPAKIQQPLSVSRDILDISHDDVCGEQGEVAIKVETTSFPTIEPEKTLISGSPKFHVESGSTEAEFSESEQFFKNLGVGCNGFRRFKNKFKRDCRHYRGRRDNCSSLSMFVSRALSAQKTYAAEHPTERALVDKVVCMQGLGFTELEICRIIDRISLKLSDVVEFVSLPLDKLRSLLLFLDDIGIRREKLGFVLRQAPALFLIDQEDVKSSVQVLGSLLEDKEAVAHMLNICPDLLLARWRSLKDTFDYLLSKVSDREAFCTQIKDDPRVLFYSTEGMQNVGKLVESLGMEEGKVGLFLVNNPFLVKCGAVQLQTHVNFLRSRELNDEVILSVIEKSTGVFIGKAKETLKSRLSYLESQGFVGEDLNRLLKSKPLALKCISANIAQKKEFILKLGFIENSPQLREALWASFTHDVEGRVKLLVAHGLEYEKVCNMIVGLPIILCLSKKSVEEKVNFLLNTMNRSVEELVTCPAFLVSQLDKKIKPRFRILAWLRSTGVLEEDISLSTLVDTPDDTFLEQFVLCYPQGPAIYQGDISGVAKCVES